MKQIKDLLYNHSNHEILETLKNAYRNKETLSEEDAMILKEFETYDYDLLGMIGLFVNCKARISLGKKQPFDQEVQDWCAKIEISFQDFEIMADKYLDDNFSEEPEHVLRYVMLEYPNKRSANS